MVRISVALMCLAFACATPNPDEYKRGTPTAPARAPVARPGVGAPIYDPQYKPLPPQPQPKPKRLLPPTREPGVWGTEPPYASTKPPRWEEREPEILGIELPEPEETSEAFRMPNRICAEIFARFDAKYMKGIARTWSEAEQNCFVALVYGECIQKEKSWLDRFKGSNVPRDRPTVVVMDWHLKKAQELARRLCLDANGKPRVTPPIVEWIGTFGGIKGREMDWRH
jgi:hypothetical protein